MLWDLLSESERKIVMSIAFSQSYSDISRATGLAPSYVSARVKKLAKRARLRYLVDYRAIGLSPLYLLLKFDQRVYELLASTQLPFIRSAVKIWDREGVKLLIEAAPPVGLERRFAQIFPSPPVNAWVKEWEAKFQPSTSSLLDFSEGALSTSWSTLPQLVSELKRTGIDVQLKPTLDVDKVDLMILRMKEEFCFTSLSEIGRSYGLSQQLASYHYRLHLRRVWIGNCIEHKHLENAVLYRVEASEPIVSHLLLKSLSEVPSIVDSFIPQGEDEVIYLIVDEPLKRLFAVHKALLHVEGVKKAELLAYIDADGFIYHGLTAHLGLGKMGWMFEELEEELSKL
ncbi:MAG: hypothetical protein QW407_01350 [Thermofilaceae archaeon]